MASKRARATHGTFEVTQGRLGTAGSRSDSRESYRSHYRKQDSKVFKCRNIFIIRPCRLNAAATVIFVSLSRLACRDTSHPGTTRRRYAGRRRAFSLGLRLRACVLGGAA